MKSKVNIELQANGTLSDITQGEDKLFQGGVAVNEYYLTIKSGITGDYNWKQTDVVYMSMIRPDGQIGQVKMTPNGTGWVYSSNGWETDVDISGSDILEISFVAKRYSVVSVGTVASEKTTESIDLTIYASSGYVPQNLDLEVAEELELEINALQLDKVGRYSVAEDNLDYLPAEITYEIDGEKTPNNLYFDFEHSVLDNGATVVKKGVLWVYYNLETLTQFEMFFCNDEKIFTRKIVDGTAGTFTSIVQAEVQDYTYSKIQADARFVHLTGNETIAGIKTFSSNPIVPTPTANTHAGNKKYTDDKVADYAYSKSQVDTTVGGLETEIARVEDLALAGNTRYVFDSTAQLTAWIAGTYTRPDDVVVGDLEIGNVIYTLPNDENDYWVKVLPVEELADLEIWLGDPLDLEASNVAFDKTGTNLDSTNAEDAIKEVNDKSDLKTQNVALEDLTIGTADWQEINDFYFYEYTNENATNPLTQKLDFVFKGDPTEADMLIAEKIIITAEEFSEVGVLGLRFRATALPSGDITFGIILSNLSNEIIPQGELQAEAISYDNTDSGLIATEVQSAVDELKGITEEISEDIGTLESELGKDLENLNNKIDDNDKLLTKELTAIINTSAINVSIEVKNSPSEFKKNVNLYVPINMNKTIFLQKGETYLATMRFSSFADNMAYFYFRIIEEQLGSTQNIFLAKVLDTSYFGKEVTMPNELETAPNDTTMEFSIGTSSDYVNLYCNTPKGLIRMVETISVMGSPTNILNIQDLFVTYYDCRTYGTYITEYLATPPATMYFRLYKVN